MIPGFDIIQETFLAQPGITSGDGEPEMSTYPPFYWGNVTEHPWHLFSPISTWGPDGAAVWTENNSFFKKCTLLLNFLSWAFYRMLVSY